MNKTHSYSKRGVMDTCLRQYFYEYYASAKRLPFDSDRKAILRKLKELTGVFLLAGDRLHWLIQMHLKKNLSRGWLERTCLEALDKAVRYSRDPETNGYLAHDQYPPPMLVEFAYQDPNAEARVEQARYALKRAVLNFFDDPRVSETWRTLLQSSPMVERRIKGLATVDGFGFEGKIDFAGRDRAGVRIIDWKLGTNIGGEDSLQMLIYGLWAEKEFALSPDQVRVQRVFLGRPYIEPERPLDRPTLKLGLARLTQDIELMRELDPYGRAGNEEAFTPCKKENVCRQCKYQDVCPENSSGLSLRPTFASLPVLTEMA